MSAQYWKKFFAEKPERISLKERDAAVSLTTPQREAHNPSVPASEESVKDNSNWIANRERKHIAELRRRLAWLDDRIAAKQPSPLSYHLSEASALRWALTLLDIYGREANRQEHEPMPQTPKQRSVVVLGNAKITGKNLQAEILDEVRR